MATLTIREKVSQEIKELPDQKLWEVLLFIEFLNAREDQDFIDYVKSRTQQAINARKKGAKFYSLKELQKEFSES